MNNSGIILFTSVLFPFLAAVISYLIGRRSKNGRDIWVIISAVAEFALVLYAALRFNGAEGSIADVCGMGLHLSLDGFRGIYGVVAAFMWMMTIFFSREYFGHYRNRNRYYFFQLITLGATMGVFLSANLFTTFIFFEIMSFTSYVWVAQDERKESMRAAETYLAVAVIGGMVLLMGLFMLYHAIGTLEIADIPAGVAAYANKRWLYTAGGCLLFGFGAKAGAFPLHIWLPKAHPVAPAPASALLSGILTKAGVYGIIVTSVYMFYGDKAWATLILVLGLITMFGGAVLAVFSVDLKRTLACSSMSQIGFILTGIAMQCFLEAENGIAVGGTFLHMMNHSLIKLDLFMIAGVVYMKLHRLNLNEVRGFGRRRPFLNIAFLMGALGIGGIPVWNGYVSKTLLHEAIIEYSTAPVFKLVEWVFLISGGLTLAYMTKLYVCLFVEKNSNAELQTRYDEMSREKIRPLSVLAIGGSAVILPILGIGASGLMMELAQKASGFMRLEEHIHIPEFWGWECIKGALISVIIGALVYFLIIRCLLMKKDEAGVREYVDAWPSWLDLENLIYRPLIIRVIPFIGVFVTRIGDCLVDYLIVFLRKTVYSDRKIPYRTGRPPYRGDIIGKLLDKQAMKHGTAGKGEEYSHRIANRTKAYERREAGSAWRATMSYGLTIAGIGCIVVFVVILL